jgi:hypothetical protein
MAKAKTSNSALSHFLVIGGAPILRLLPQKAAAPLSAAAFRSPHGRRAVAFGTAIEEAFERLRMPRAIQQAGNGYFFFGG